MGIWVLASSSGLFAAFLTLCAHDMDGNDTKNHRNPGIVQRLGIGC